MKNRLWAIALIGLAFFFLFPVMAALMAGDLQDAVNYERAVQNYAENMQELLSFSFGATSFFMMIIALICGMSSFSYVNSKSKVDFYHGLPIRREKLYLVNSINGILIMAIPYGIMLVLGVIVAISNGANDAHLWHLAGTAFILNLVYYMLMYHTVIVSVMLTGNLVVSCLGVAVFCSIIPAVAGTILAYYNAFFDSFLYWHHEPVLDWSVRFSPVAEYVRQVGAYASTFREGGVGQVSAGALGGALAATVILAVTACVLYCKRPSEAAGKAMAFRISRPIIRIIITIEAALGSGLFFWAIRSNARWGVFGIFCGGIIAHCVIEIIYHFDFKKLFSHRLQLTGCLAVSLLIFGIFQYDWFGYDRYLPKEGQVKEAAINVNTLNAWVSYGETVHWNNGNYMWQGMGNTEYTLKEMKETDVKAILALAEAGIAFQQEGTSNRGMQTRIEILYTLNNGRKVSRTYFVNLSDDELLERLYASEKFQKGTYPVLSLLPEQVADIRYREAGEEQRLSRLTETEKAELLTTFQQEWQEMTIGQMKKEAPVGLIRFAQPLEMEGLDAQERSEERYYYGDLIDRNYYPVYPSFQKTVQLLANHHIYAGDALIRLPIDEIQLEYTAGKDDGNLDEIYTRETQVAVFDQPEEIAVLRELLCQEDILYYNDLYQRQSSYRGWVNYRDHDGSVKSISVSFPIDRAPEFVKKRLTQN